MGHKRFRDLALSHVITKQPCHTVNLQVEDRNGEKLQNKTAN